MKNIIVLFLSLLIVCCSENNENKQIESDNSINTNKSDMLAVSLYSKIEIAYNTYNYDAIPDLYMKLTNEYPDYSGISEASKMYSYATNKELIKKDSDLRKKLFETLLTRENLELITRKYCGLIPASITTDPYGRAHYDYDRQSMMLLAKSVFSTAYLENRQTTIQMNNSERSGFSKSSTKKGKGLFDRIFGTSDKSKKDENQNQLGTYNNTTTYTKNEGVLFYRSGVVIFNKSKFLKFNYATKDTETGIQTEVNNFLISDFDEDRLRWDDEYRKNFVKEVLTPSRLKNNRGVPLFPFIGEFTDSGHFQNNIDVWVAFNEITEGYRQ